jgi:hypothetical protein
MRNFPIRRRIFVNWRFRKGGNRRGPLSLDSSNESISASWPSFNVTGILSAIAQRPPEFIDRRIQAVFEINEGLFGPDLLAQLLAANKLAWMCH